MLRLVLGSILQKFLLLILLVGKFYRASPVKELRRTISRHVLELLIV